MISIRNTDRESIDSIINLVNMNKNILQPNNRMIYYLCCTIFSNTSFIATINDLPVGFIIAFPDSNQTIIWIHQFAVSPENKNLGVGSRLLKTLEDSITQMNESITKIRLAVKPENNFAKKFYLKRGYKLLTIEKEIGMEIYEKKAIPDKA